MSSAPFNAFLRLMAVPTWFQAGKDGVGMYYDLDAAILKTCGVNDDQFSLTYAPDGCLTADICLPYTPKTIEQLNSVFFKMWARVSFAFSLVH